MPSAGRRSSIPRSWRASWASRLPPSTGALTGLLADGIVGRMSHGTAHLPSSRRYFRTAEGIKEAAGLFGSHSPSEFVRTYAMSKKWLASLIRRMDAVASIYRLAASLSPRDR